jgi:hypothetical protein
MAGFSLGDFFGVFFPLGLGLGGTGLGAVCRCSGQTAGVPGAESRCWLSAALSLLLLWERDALGKGSGWADGGFDPFSFLFLF